MALNKKLPPDEALGLQFDVWFGIVIGFENTKTIKGIMRAVNLQDNTLLLEREDGISFAVSMDKVTMLSSEDVGGHPASPRAIAWVKDHQYVKDDRDNPPKRY